MNMWTITKMLVISIALGLLWCSDGKEPACNVEDLGLIPGLARSPVVGHGNPLQYSCLENPYGQRNLAGYIHGVAKCWTQLRD